MTQTAVRTPTRTRTLRVPHMTASVPATRRIVVEDLTERGVPQVIIDEAETVVAELLGNAVRHARSLADGSIRVHWQIKGSVVELDVTDGGSRTIPRAIQPATYAVAGRGLRVVRSMAHEWGVVDEERSRTVWVCLGGPSRRRRP
jgi:serine/threonine-protein kinase RsbW